MIVVKKINGDAYAEIIRDNSEKGKGQLINLKPLNPSNVRIVLNKKGLIIRYEEYDTSSKQTKRKFKVSEILHLCNNRVANEIHGVSVIEACKWIIDARNEAMSDWRRILHRSTIRVLEVDSQDITKLTYLNEQYSQAIKNGELLILPIQDGGGFKDLSPPSITNFLEWIRYLENFFYQAVGIPKIILGGSQDFTEASSKVGYLTFEQVYMAEQRLLEQDLFNQLGVIIEFNRPVSLKENVQTDEGKNTVQTGFQPNEMQAGMTKNE
jgi:hypothetical protein